MTLAHAAAIIEAKTGRAVLDEYLRETLLHGSRERCSRPLYCRFLHDADGFWASKLQHPVQDADSDGNLGGPPEVHVRS
jgi:hypothetical protein